MSRLLTLNRPDRLNALNKDLAVALNQALLSISTDKHISVVVITGAGRAFCAGGDLAVIGKGHQENDMTDLEPLLRAGMGSVMKIRTMRQPVIAAVNGPAAGAGMNIALAADIRIAADSASFGQNFVNVGLFPDYGGTYFLPELVGPAKAAELFYTGEMIDAKTALQLGIVNRVVPAAELADAAKAFARKLADGPHLPIQAVKHVLFGDKRDALEAGPRSRSRATNEVFPVEGLRRRHPRLPRKAQTQIRINPRLATSSSLMREFLVGLPAARCAFGA